MEELIQEKAKPPSRTLEIRPKFNFPISMILVRGLHNTPELKIIFKREFLLNFLFPSSKEYKICY
jgi:hypothetical protein